MQSCPDAENVLRNGVGCGIVTSDLEIHGGESCTQYGSGRMTIFSGTIDREDIVLSMAVACRELLGVYLFSKMNFTNEAIPEVERKFGGTRYEARICGRAHLPTHWLF